MRISAPIGDRRRARSHQSGPPPILRPRPQAKSPRFFCLDPSAKILYAANADEGFSGQQNTDTIVPFRINQANGMLTPTGQVIKTNSPCTIVFAEA
jgi:6-phosphogluconolactonase (cycloisomerase 2 family)